MVGSHEVWYALSITFTNPAFEISADNGRRNALAQAIASSAAESYPLVDRFRFITVTFADVRQVGIIWSTQLTYAFPTGSLVCPVAPEDWRIIVSEDFATNDNGWPTSSEANEFMTSSIQIAQGTLTMSATALQASYAYKHPDTKRLTDFYLQAEVRQTSGPPDDFYGVVFRVSDWKQYFFGISDSQDFVLRKRRDQQGWADTLVLAPSLAVQPGGSNTLTILAEGDSFSACINGQLVAQVEDADYKEGVVGIGLILYHEGDKAVLEYAGFRVLAPPR